jgi:hypothetical protein
MIYDIFSLSYDTADMMKTRSSVGSGLVLALPAGTSMETRTYSFGTNGSLTCVCPCCSTASTKTGTKRPGCTAGKAPPCKRCRRSSSPVTEMLAKKVHFTLLLFVECLCLAGLSYVAYIANCFQSFALRILH